MEETFAVEIARRLWDAEHTGEDVSLAGDDYSRMIAEARAILKELGVVDTATILRKLGLRRL